MYFGWTHSRLVENQKWRFYLESQTNNDRLFSKKKTQNQGQVKRKIVEIDDSSGFSISATSPKKVSPN